MFIISTEYVTVTDCVNVIDGITLRVVESRVDTHPRSQYITSWVTVSWSRSYPPFCAMPVGPSTQICSISGENRVLAIRRPIVSMYLRPFGFASWPKRRQAGSPCSVAAGRIYRDQKVFGLEFGKLVNIRNLFIPGQTKPILKVSAPHTPTPH